MTGAARSDSGTAVVYIAYGPYGVEPLRRFVASYRRFPAGTVHDLVIAWKAVTPTMRAAMAPLLADLPHHTLEVPDGGFDLGTYRHVATLAGYARYCFINTNSELRAPDWLAKLAAGLDAPGVVAAGATASYQSLATDCQRRIGMRRTWRALAIAKRWLLHRRFARRYPPFPNPHLRTNGILIDRATFLALDLPTLRTKEDATGFESGWNGMTRQLEREGGRVVLVDAAGRVLPPPRWPGSASFWQGGQDALLIADNQTRRYDEAAPAERVMLATFAWAPLTRPPLSPDGASSA